MEKEEIVTAETVENTTSEKKAKKGSTGKTEKLAKKLEIDTLTPISLNVGGKLVKVLQYLPITQKLIIIDTVVNMSLISDPNSDSEIKRYDSVVKEISLLYMLVKYYTDLGVTKTSDIFEAYDILMSTGANNIIDFIPLQERVFIENGIESRVREEQRVMEANSSLGVVLKSMTGIFDRKLVEALETINSFDPSQLTMLTSFLSEEDQQKLVEEK